MGDYLKNNRFNRVYNDAIEILTLNNIGTAYSWGVSASTWAKVERLDKVNLFSKVGIGVASAMFSMRKCVLTLHNAISWQGKHYFLTDIIEVKRKYFEVMAAQIEPKICIATRNSTTLNELNRPILTSQQVATFPACLVEKYLGYQQEKPQAVQDMTYVLVTPKDIELQVADLVTVGQETYNIRIPHCLDEYKNEYEMTLIKDV